MLSQCFYLLLVFIPNSQSYLGEILTYINVFSLLAPGFIQNMLLTFVATEFCNYSPVFAWFFCSILMGYLKLNLIYTQLFMQYIFQQFCVVPRFFFIFWYSVYRIFHILIISLRCISKFRSFSFNSFCTCCICSTCAMRLIFCCFIELSTFIKLMNL